MVFPFRDDAFAIFYTADAARLKALLPSDRLHPVTLSRNRALFGVACFNYIDTTIGPLNGPASLVARLVRYMATLRPCSKAPAA